MNEKEELKNLLSKTYASDDISILINLIRQFIDLGNDATTQIPDATCHCKYWQDFSANDIADALEEKYAGEKGLAIPNEFITSF